MDQPPTPSETLEQRIIRHEGFVFTPKPDAKGAWVVGFGHDITPQEAHDYANGISEDDAMDLLNADIALARNEVAKDLPWTSELSPIRQDVLTEMVFQLGLSGLLGFRNLLFHLHSGDFASAAHDMLASLWHEQTAERCEELANLMLHADTPTS